jgi:predicted DNA-binding transcriptional regulator YafY
MDKLGALAKNKEDEKYLLKSNTLIIDIGSWSNPNRYRNRIEIINKAIESGLTLDIEYTNRNENYSSRLVDPYSVVLKEGVWYLFGWCHLRRDFRLFKISRIKEIKISTSPYVRKESDVYKKLHESFDDQELVDIEIEFYSLVYSEVEEWLGGESIVDKGGNYYAKATVLGGNMLISKLMSFGSSIKVISPKKLREDLLEECKRIMLFYGQ